MELPVFPGFQRKRTERCTAFTKNGKGPQCRFGAYPGTYPPLCKTHYNTPARQEAALKRLETKPYEHPKPNLTLGFMSAAEMVGPTGGLFEHEILRRKVEQFLEQYKSYKENIADDTKALTPWSYAEEIIHHRIPGDYVGAARYQDINRVHGIAKKRRKENIGTGEFIHESLKPLYATETGVLPFAHIGLGRRDLLKVYYGGGNYNARKIIKTPSAAPKKSLRQRLENPAPPLVPRPRRNVKRPKPFYDPEIHAEVDAKKYAERVGRRLRKKGKPLSYRRKNRIVPDYIQNNF
jgi:hypothetical protein